MALKIIEGIPGSGKTYYAVHHVAKSYFKIDKEGFFERVKDVVLISNIDDLKFPHIDLDAEIKKEGGFHLFFAKEFQDQYREKYEQSIVYIIDEAQDYFRSVSKAKLSDVFSYFEFHRHYGQDIYLITQNSSKLPKDITTLVEYTVRAAARIRSIAGELKYSWISCNEIIKREGLKPDKHIFALYKSMDAPEAEKISNPVIRSAVAALAVVVVIGCCGFFYLKSTLGGSGVSSAEASVPQEDVNSSKNQSINNEDFNFEPTSYPSRGRADLASVNPASFFYVVPVSVVITEKPAPFTFSGSDPVKKLIKSVSIFWNEEIFNESDFPYKLIKRGKKYFAVLDPDIFDFTFTEDSTPFGTFIIKDV